MSTRGAVGIRMNGMDKVGYNHFDSYPSGLGDEILSWLSKNNIENLKDIYESIELSDDWENPTWDWENHKINTIFENQEKFLYDSLFCEFAYIVNLDTKMLEFYIGFNKDPDAPGRYSNKKDDESGYYGVRLEKEIPLSDLFENKYEIYEYDNGENFKLKN